ncbi:hypothetical protein [Anaerobiospirillum succiniciproducens]|uniref:hypothetical protein n=1 Tax=Anaerobiospirillum succiniciproducens TaxID=13335 RepID=UPI003F8A562E
MNIVEIQTIKLLFASGQYLKLYESQAHIINEILSIKTENEFQDFLNEIGWFDEGVFWLHYGSWHGKSLFVGAYDEDIADKVRCYLNDKLPENLFEMLEECLDQLNVDADADDEDNLMYIIDDCNEYLEGTGYSLNLVFEDTYYDGAYFLSVLEP